MRFLKGTKMHSILTSSCPVCQEENMYLDKNMYNIRNAFKMHDRCSHCGTKYKIEPSFFFGAMYVSYGLGCAIGIGVFLICYYLLHWGVMGCFFAIIGVLFLLFPVILRISRNIWINFFLHYDKTATLKH